MCHMGSHSALAEVNRLRKGQVYEQVKALREEGKSIEAIAAAVTKRYVPVSRETIRRLLLEMDAERVREVEEACEREAVK